MRLTLADVAYDRSVPGRAAGLFLTDRCPVGCGHCSVDSRRDSPTVTDHDLLAEIVRALADRPELRSVAITGGEPFVERRGLRIAVRDLAAAGKSVVLFTSGVWAKPRSVPAWIREVLAQAACVFLSTDAYHTAGVDEEAFVRAARTVVDEVGGLVVQVLATPAMVDEAVRLLEVALGPRWADHAELSRTSPLPYGRGAALFAGAEPQPAESFGRCALVNSPIVRYDGTALACCNEQVIMGHGAERLRRRCGSKDDVDAALDGFHHDPLLRALGGVGAGPLTLHPTYRHLRDERFAGICQLCWRLQDTTSATGPDGLLDAVAALQPRGGAS